jgi:hypothetical protein
MIVEEVVRHTGGKVKFSDRGGADARNYRVCFEKIAHTLGFEAMHPVREYVPQLVLAVRGGLFLREREISDYYGNYRVYRLN